VLTVARSPEVQFRWQMGSREPLARRFQRYFDRISRLQLSVFNNLNAAPGDVRRTLQPVQAEVDALTEQAHTLCVRMTTLENYRLVSKSRLDTQTDQRRIDTALHHTDDPLVADDYADSQRALDSLRTQLETVTNQLDRVEAQLLSLVNEMDTIVTELVRLQTLEPADAAHYVPGLVQQLQAQAAELRVFQREAMAIQ
jgi:chromosome segregation ATPase